MRAEIPIFLKEAAKERSIRILAGLALLFGSNLVTFYFTSQHYIDTYDSQLDSLENEINDQERRLDYLDNQIDRLREQPLPTPAQPSLPNPPIRGPQRY